MPLSVSTLMAVASTLLASTKRAFTAVVIAVSSTYWPTVDWLRLTAQPGRTTRADTAARAATVARNMVYLLEVVAIGIDPLVIGFDSR